MADITIEDVQELQTIYNQLQAEEVSNRFYRQTVHNILGNLVLEATDVTQPEPLPQPPAASQIIDELAAEDHFAAMEPTDTELQLRLRLLRHAYGDNDQAIVNALIENDYQAEVAAHLDKLPPAQQRATVDFLLEADCEEVVASNLERLKPAHRLETAMKIIAGGYGEYVAERFDIFKPGTQARLINALFENDYGDEVASHIEKVSPAYHQKIALRLMDKDSFYSLRCALPYLKLTDPTKVALRLIEESYPEVIAVIFKHFEGTDKDAVIDALFEHEAFTFLVGSFEDLRLRPATLLKHMTEAGEYRTIAHNLSRFQKVKDSTGIKLIEMGWQRQVAENIGAFTNKRMIAEALIDREAGDKVLGNFAGFKIPETEEFVMRCIRAGGLAEFLENIYMFETIDKSAVADYILATEDVFALDTAQIDKLGAALKIPSDLVFTALKNGTIGMDRLGELQGHIAYASHHAHWKAIIEAAGDFLSPELIDELEALRGGNLEGAEMVRSLGVAKTGQEGVRQFLDIIRSLKSRLLNPDKATLGLALDNERIQDLMRDCYRANEGSYSHNGFPEAVRRAYERFEEYLPKEGFVDSEVYKIHSANAKNTASRQEFDEDVVLRYQRLKGQLEAAGEHVQSMGSSEILYGGTLAVLAEYVDDKVGQLGARRAELAGDGQQARSIAGLDIQIDGLQAVLTRGVDSLEHLEDNFLTLAKDKKLGDDIMTVLCARLMRFDLSLPPAERKKRFLDIQSKIASLAEEPTTKSLATMISLIEDLQATSERHFQTAEAQERFAKLTSVNSLTIALDKLDKRKNIGMVFQPSRGLLLEVSGQLADACWENQYDNIADELPNVTAVTIRRSPGGKNDRLVGSFILIETRDAQTEEPVLIIRGLNPIENFINSVDVDDFFDVVFDYTHKTADRLGAKLGIAIADSSVSFGTNRPVVHGYMAKMKRGLTRVPVPRSETEFNGYEIQDDVYLVPR
ncbi:MAG TPA: hypothetical protein VK712_02900 [Verrucomicrobiae bacterium]|nr:hypothetical protein [Verrucomicrobiae bacterium]